jgi:hypothetical protein
LLGRIKKRTGKNPWSNRKNDQGIPRRLRLQLSGHSEAAYARLPNKDQMVCKMVLLSVSPWEPPFNWLLLLRNKSASFSFIRLQLLLKPIFIGVPRFLDIRIIPLRNLESLSNYITLFFFGRARERGNPAGY